MGCGGRWEGGSKGRGYMYTDGWFMLRFDRKQNSVKQLSFNKKNKVKKQKKKKKREKYVDICNSVKSYNLIPKNPMTIIL